MRKIDNSVSETLSIEARLRVVIPVLNEGAQLTENLIALQDLRSEGVQIVVVDGGSTDESWVRARPWVDYLLASSPGRAQQMNAGAFANGLPPARCLLFLHADTRLPKNAHLLIESALENHVWGRFDVRLDGGNLVFRVIEKLMNLRSRLSRISTGDQAIFVRANTFASLQGYPNQSLMEDIYLSSRLRKISSPACISAQVTTSTRKWEKNGVFNTIFLMWKLRLAYFFGANPQNLARQYGYHSSPPPSQASVAVMAKAPTPGLAKTRLAPAVGFVGAARLQRVFCLQTLHTVAQSEVANLTLWCAPNNQHRHFRALSKHFDVLCRSQPNGNIGERMLFAAQTHFVRPNSSPLLIIGTDCPQLSPGHIRRAAQALEKNNVCIIPAEDGGYVLIGLRALTPAIFSEIAWSTNSVLSQTLDRCKAAGLSVTVLEVIWDVDEPADLSRWHALINRALPATLPNSLLSKHNVSAI